MSNQTDLPEYGVKNPVNNKKEPVKDIVLVSGGLDSACMLALAKSEGSDIIAVHYNYGQPTEQRELENAKRLCKHFNVPLVVKDLKLIMPKGGLSDENQDFTTPTEASGVSTGYVPFRNSILILIGAGVGVSAEKTKKICIWHGAQLIDYSAYADCRPEFFDGLCRVLELSMTEQKFEIKTPFVKTLKTKVLQLGIKLKVPFELTFSCYKMINGKACSKCGACEERIEAFAKAGIKDPLEYN